MDRRRGPHVARRLVVAALLLSLPAVVCLIALYVLGDVGWHTALLGLMFVVVAQAALLAPHFAHVEALRRYLEAQRRTGGRGVPLPLPPGRRSAILAPELDETIIETANERERRRRELEAAMAGNEAILASLPDPLLSLNRARRIVRANPAAEELLGGGLLGQDLVVVLRHPALLRAADAAIAGEAGQEVAFAQHGDIERRFQARAVPLPTPALDGTVALVALHDTTAQFKAEQLRGDFVANASHELRTPLSSLLGFIETLRGPARDDVQARDAFLTIMQEQAQRMTRLVEDLMSLSRIEMREHTPPAEAVDLAAVVESVVRGLELRAQAKGMALRVDLADIPAVAGDEDELVQVFQNLIENAVKYGRPGTPVVVEARLVEPQSDAGARRIGRSSVSVSVVDQGEGIAREHLPRLTERFYRVDNARSRALGGTGLGLAIVKHIVNRHRGLLTVESTVGKGSRFTVTLPSVVERPSAALRRAG